MERFRVVICGGGVAALEGLLRLRRLVGDAVDVTLVAPNEEFAYRALSVKEPFAFGRARRYPLRRILSDHHAEWVQDRLERVDPDSQVLHTTDGHQLPYDALLLALGGRMSQPFEHVKTFGDEDADALFRGVVQDIEEGYSKSVAFLAPDGPAWPLPLYELALLTAERARGMGMDDVELSLVTPEAEPLAAFGPPAGEAVSALLERWGIAVYTSARASVPERGRVQIEPLGVELSPQRAIAMPSIAGPGLRGVPHSRGGFIPVDERCAVRGAEHVFAAGDATDFPAKQGGLGAQQADAAAAEIARLAGADVDPAPFEPVLRGMLLHAGGPLFLSARLDGGEPVESEVSEEPLWQPVEKVASEELGPYLEQVDARGG